MRKYKEILTTLIERVNQKEGIVDDGLRRCAGRAQLLAHISGKIASYYRSGVLDLELLREMFEEKELNKCGIYTKGCVGMVGGKAVVAVGDCRCDVGGTTLAYAFDDANITAWEAARVYAYDRANVTATSRSRIWARDNSTVFATDMAHVRAYDKTIISAEDTSRVVAKGQSRIHICGDCAARVLGHDVAIHAYGYATVHFDGATSLDLGGCAVAVNVNTHEVTYGEGLHYMSEPSL